MSEAVVQVQNLGKRYRIGGRRAAYGMLRETMTAAVVRSMHWLKNGKAKDHPDEFWALRDISFDVQPGEVLGIIGPNGAGKSTLLKILSRVTHPTEGQVDIQGRVGSLLEVGTGFHPELSGRENIFLNGAVLGMKKAEIQRKFDEIVAFAGVEQFLDMPVKRYSSGMYMRLAFAVAAHLEPEILIIDEVLAVGDSAFQKKCLGKMNEAAHQGRTVLFVSHNMTPILALCGRVLLLEQGNLVAQGNPQDTVKRYLHGEFSRSLISLDQRNDRQGDGSARMLSLQVESTDPDKIIRSTSQLKFIIGYSGEKPLLHPKFLINIYDYMDVGIYLLHNEFVGGLPDILPLRGSVTCLTERINLTPGRCVVHLELLTGDRQVDYVPYAGSFDVEADDFFGSGKLPPRDWVFGLLGHKWWLNPE